MARIRPPAGQQSSVLVSGGLLHAACSSALQQDAYLRYRGELRAGDSGHMPMNRKYKINLGISMRAGAGSGHLWPAARASVPAHPAGPGPKSRYRAGAGEIMERRGGGFASENWHRDCVFGHRRMFLRCGPNF